MRPAGGASERRYQCPKCKREVTVLLGAISVSCHRCGRRMKRVEKGPAPAVHA